jgi:hypothetical protein
MFVRRWKKKKRGRCNVFEALPLSKHECNDVAGFDALLSTMLRIRLLLLAVGMRHGWRRPVDCDIYSSDV